MTATNHTLAGVTIGLIIPLPFSPVLALLSHFLLDAVPHFGNHPVIRPWTRQFKIFLTLDCLTAFVVLILAGSAYEDRPIVVSCGILAALPDVMWAVEKQLRPYAGKLYYFHKVIQWSEQPYNWPVEIIHLTLMAIFLISAA